MQVKCRCGHNPIYYRRYENAYYCAECLNAQIERKFKKELKYLEMKKTAVALSGGVDSLVLLWLMNKFYRGKFFALSIDEGIRGYRKKTLNNAKKLTKKFGIEHFIFSFKNEYGFCNDTLPKNIKYCTFCGILRRYLLNKKARELDAERIVMGCNLDDEAQSVYLNFIRGDMFRFLRLGVMPNVTYDKKFVPRVKPLRNILKKEIMLYAISKNIEFAENLRCPYSGNNMRRDVQKAINKLEHIYPATKIQIVKFYDRLRNMINYESNTRVNHCKKCGEPCSEDICKVCKIKEWLDQAHDMVSK